VTGRDSTVVADLDTLSRSAADTIERAAHHAVAARGRFIMALSGGSTPRTLYRLLAAEYRDRVPWAATELFFGDERCVPPTHPDSNFAMARETLLAPIPGLEARTHRIAGERGAEPAAREYGRLLRATFPPSEPATFDVVLLGVGTDGHTASLFPGSPALDERQHWAVATEAPPGVTTRSRVTLTFPVLDAAADILILCAGVDKRPVLERIRALGDAAGAQFPVARITAREHVRWFVDQAAAG
jgi:6-phosphogluconolactonase